MKRLLTLSLALIMVLSLAACGGNAENPGSTPDSTPSDSNSPVDETPSTTSESDDPGAGPDEGITPENAHTATETGVYLYDGTFLEFGQTIKLSDDGANLDMPVVEIDFQMAHRQDDGTDNLEDGTHLTLGAAKPICSSSSGFGNAIFSQDEYVGLFQGEFKGIVHNDNDTDFAGDCIGSALFISIREYNNNRYPAIIINGAQVTDYDGNNVEKMIEAFGTPFGAYCFVSSTQSWPSLYYIWKSSSCDMGTLIMAYQINFGGFDAKQFLNFFIADEVGEWSDEDLASGYNAPVYLMPALEELGLYQ